MKQLIVQAQFIEKTIPWLLQALVDNDKKFTKSISEMLWQVATMQQLVETTIPQLLEARKYGIKVKVETEKILFKLVTTPNVSNDSTRVLLKVLKEDKSWKNKVQAANILARINNPDVAAYAISGISGLLPQLMLEGPNIKSEVNKSLKKLCTLRPDFKEKVSEISETLKQKKLELNQPSQSILENKAQSEQLSEPGPGPLVLFSQPGRNVVQAHHSKQEPKLRQSVEILTSENTTIAFFSPETNLENKVEDKSKNGSKKSKGVCCTIS